MASQAAYEVMSANVLSILDFKSNITLSKVKNDNCHHKLRDNMIRIMDNKVKY